MYAICGNASATTGSRKRQALVLPLQLAGNHCNFTAKNKINKGAMTNTGIEIPVIARPIVNLSSTEFCRSAARVPKLTPTSTASAIARTPSFIETGMALPISSDTL